MKALKVTMIGAPIALGQTQPGVELAPDALRQAGLAEAVRELGHNWQDRGNLLVSPADSRLLATTAAGSVTGAVTATERVHHSRELSDACRRLADTVEQAARSGENDFVLTVGGDHSVALGSISGLLSHYNGPEQSQLGLIWVDAHGDFNTPETSQSGNFHGMPLAALLGYQTGLTGFEWFYNKAVKLAPAQVALVGVRSLDEGERQLLRDSGIAVFTMKEVDRYGIGRVMEQALERVDPQGQRPLHVSFDIDAVDPAEAPGTGTLVKGGLTYRESHLILEVLAETGRLHSMDLVEINPQLEPTGSQPTVKLGLELILSALGKTIF